MPTRTLYTTLVPVTFTTAALALAAAPWLVAGSGISGTADWLKLASAVITAVLGFLSGKKHEQRKRK